MYSKYVYLCLMQKRCIYIIISIFVHSEQRVMIIRNGIVHMPCTVILLLAVLVTSFGIVISFTKTIKQTPA